MRKIILVILLTLNYSCLSASAIMEYNENDNSQTFDGQSFFESVNTGSLTVIGPMNLNANGITLGPNVQVNNPGVNQGDVLSVDAGGNLKFMPPTGGSGATPGAGTVTANTIAPGAVGTAAIEDGSISTEKIIDGAITNPKIGNGAVTDTKIAAGAITNRPLSGFSAPAGTGNISPTTTIIEAVQSLDTGVKTNADAISDLDTRVSSNENNINSNDSDIATNQSLINSNTGRLGNNETRIGEIINGTQKVGASLVSDLATLANGIAPGQSVDPNQISPRTGSGSVVLDMMPTLSQALLSDGATFLNGFTVGQSAQPAAPANADSGLIFYDQNDKEFKVFQGGLGNPVSLVGSGGQANFTDVIASGNITAADGSFNNLNVSANGDIDGALTLGPANLDVLATINSLQNTISNGPLNASTLAGLSANDFASAAQGANADAANTLSQSNSTRITNNEGNISNLQGSLIAIQSGAATLNNPTFTGTVSLQGVGTTISMPQNTSINFDQGGPNAASFPASVLQNAADIASIETKNNQQDSSINTNLANITNNTNDINSLKTDALQSIGAVSRQISSVGSSTTFSTVPVGNPNRDAVIAEFLNFAGLDVKVDLQSNELIINEQRLSLSSPQRIGASTQISLNSSDQIVVTRLPLGGFLDDELNNGNYVEEYVVRYFERL